MIGIDAIDEAWKDVLGYEGLYKVSNYGKVLSVKRGIILKQWMVRGYLYVPLNKNGRQKNVRVNRIVARAFVENQSGYDCVDHINGDRADNRANNLRWCTYLQNSNNPITRENLSKAKKGENNPFYKVFGKDHCSSKQVKQFSLDGTFIRLWACAADVSRELGIQFSNISRCCHGRSNSAGGYIWEFA